MLSFIRGTMAFLDFLEILDGWRWREGERVEEERERGRRKRRRGEGEEEAWDTEWKEKER